VAVQRENQSSIRCGGGGGWPAGAHMQAAAANGSADLGRPTLAGAAKLAAALLSGRRGRNNANRATLTSPP